MKFLTFVCFAGVLVGLNACATRGPDVPSMSEKLRESTGQNGRACVRDMEVRGYGVLRNNVLSIDGGRRYYLATVLPGCTDMSTSARAFFSGSFGEICGQSMHRMVTRDSSCTINQVFRFDDREQAFAVYNEVLERREELRSAAAEEERQ